MSLITNTVIFSILLFSLIGLFSPNLVFADAYSDAVEDSKKRCVFLGEKSRYDAESPYSKIEMAKIAQESFNARGLPGTDWSLYESQFLQQCYFSFAQGYAKAAGSTKSIYTIADAQTKGYQDGENNFDCSQDGQRKTIPTDFTFESRTAMTNPFNPISEADLWEVYTIGFREGCLIRAGLTEQYGSSFTDGSDVGKRDSSCNESGRQDAKDGKPLTQPDQVTMIFNAELANPYKPILEQKEREKFTQQYIQGCKYAYSTGYTNEKRTEKSSVGSFFDDDGGCLIATAAYRTELAPEVQNLREIRNKMYETESGGEVMHAVNDFYYSFSPTVADWERENPAFREAVKILITPSMASFTILDHHSIDSEEGLIGYVIGAIILNAGMYFVAPTIVIIGIRKRF